MFNISQYAFNAEGDRGGVMLFSSPSWQLMKAKQAKIQALEAHSVAIGKNFHGLDFAIGSWNTTQTVKIWLFNYINQLGKVIWQIANICFFSWCMKSDSERY